MSKMYRQGDVLLVQVDSSDVPKSLKKSKNRLLVQGEGRDHGHYAMGDGVTILDAPNRETDVVVNYLQVKGDDATLEHLNVHTEAWTQEHEPIALPEGDYKVIRQVEYDPFAKAAERVRD